jgi:hypothetical protein
MLRFVLSAMAVAGILATTLPAFANPATAADHAPSCGGRQSAARPTGTGPVVAIGCAGGLTATTPRSSPLGPAGASGMGMSLLWAGGALLRAATAPGGQRTAAFARWWMRSARA